MIYSRAGGDFVPSSGAGSITTLIPGPLFGNTIIRRYVPTTSSVRIVPVVSTL